MEISEFNTHFASQLEETDAAAIHPHTKLREIEEWSSLTALSVIALVDEVYHVKIKGDEIRNVVDLQHDIIPCPNPL